MSKVFQFVCLNNFSDKKHVKAMLNVSQVRDLVTILTCLMQLLSRRSYGDCIN